MKVFILISIFLITGFYGFGQRDTTNLFWENGLKKYEHICCYTDSIYLTKSSNDNKELIITEYITETFWNKNGLKIDELDFIKLNGSIDINEIRKSTSNKKNISYNTDYLTNKYSRHIKSADNYFFEKNYTQAIKLYNLALRIKPHEDYPTMQLKKLASPNEIGQEKIDSSSIKNLFNSIECPRGWNKSLIWKENEIFFFPEREALALFTFSAKERYFKLFVFEKELLNDSTFNYNLRLSSAESSCRPSHIGSFEKEGFYIRPQLCPKCNFDSDKKCKKLAKAISEWSTKN